MKILIFLLLFNFSVNAQTKIGPQELKQPFVITSLNTNKQALIVDNDYNIGNGYNFVVSTMGYVGIGVTQPNSMLDINANINQQYALTIDSNSNASDGYVVSITTTGVLSRIDDWALVYARSYYPNYTTTPITISIPLLYSYNGSYIMIEMEGIKIVNGGDLVFYPNGDTTTIKPITIDKTYVNTGVIWGISPVDSRATGFLATTNDFNTEQRFFGNYIFQYQAGWILYNGEVVLASPNQYGGSKFRGGYLSNASITSININSSGSSNNYIYSIRVYCKKPLNY